MLAELIAQCVAHPDDDDPRLVYADAVDGDRGELIAVECAIARGELRPEIAIDRRRREAELLRQAATFANLDGLATDYEFRRGFVESASVEWNVFVERGEELFQRAPLLSRIDMGGLFDVPEAEILKRLDAVIAAPWFARIHTLRMVEVGQWVDTESDYNPRDFRAAGSAVMRRLVESGALATLRGIEMPSSGLSGSDLRRLGECPQASGLVTLSVRHQDNGRYTGLDSSDIAALVELPHLGALENLDVAGALGHGPMLGGQTREERRAASRAAADGDAKLLAHPRFRALRSLGIARGSFSEAMIDALATSSFTRLERLDLSRNDVFAEDWTRIANAPGFAKLRELQFDGPCQYVFDAKMATALGATPANGGFPALRILRVQNNMVTAEAATALVASPLAAQLEVLDLRRNSNLKATALRERFKGMLLVDGD